MLDGGDTPDTFEASAETVANALPNARITVIDGQAHGAELFAPELVTGQVLAFLQVRHDRLAFSPNRRDHR